MTQTNLALEILDDDAAVGYQPWQHLDELESESIHILREVVAEMKNPVLLFSAGKDSTILLHLARKAFAPGKLPFPLLHIDTGHNFPEVIQFRDQVTKQFELRMIVRNLQDSIDTGRIQLKSPTQSRNPFQTCALPISFN